VGSLCGHEAALFMPGCKRRSTQIINLAEAICIARNQLQCRHVALKEYMPAAFAARSIHAKVAVRSERYGDYFEAGLRSFVHEARILAHFDHPSLLKVYPFWEENGTAYMVMPYYQGPTLKQVLLDHAGPPGEAWLKGLLAPLLDTLGLIHEQQYFHRDISPDNILILADGWPLLLGFGAARRESISSLPSFRTSCAISRAQAK
jgi:serine/threonine protein kinase